MEKYILMFEDGQELSDVITTAFYNKENNTINIYGVFSNGKGLLVKMKRDSSFKDGDNFYISAKDFYSALLTKISNDPPNLECVKPFFLNTNLTSKVYDKPLKNLLLDYYQLIVAKAYYNEQDENIRRKILVHAKKTQDYFDKVFVNHQKDDELLNEIFKKHNSSQTQMEK